MAKAQLIRRPAFTTELLSDWSRGYVTDVPDLWLPDNAVVDSLDFLFDRPGVARKRGGSVYLGAAFGSSYTASVMYAPYVAGDTVLAQGDNGSLYKIAPGSDATVAWTTVGALGAGWPSLGRMAFFNNLAIIPAWNGTSSPLKYDGSAAPSALAAGSPPGVQHVDVHLSRIVGAGASANPRRVYWSPTPNPDSAWDTANAWLDADHPVVGLAVTQAGLWLFSNQQVEIVTGTTPPPGSNLSKRVYASIGCVDARSIVVYNNTVIWANQNGVFMGDGTSEPINLVEEGGIAADWETKVGLLYSSSMLLSAGMIGHDYLYVNRWHASPTPTDWAWVCYLPRKTWMPVTSCRGRVFSASVGRDFELYSAARGTNRVEKIASMIDSNRQVWTAAGAVVAPYLVTRMIGKPALYHYDRLRTTALFRSAGGTPAVLTVDAITGQDYNYANATTIGTITSDTSIPATSLRTSSIPIAQQAAGLMLKFTHGSVNASTVCEIFGVEVDVRPFPAGMVAT